MRYTVEADANKAIVTLEVNGDTFKQEWKRVSSGRARATDSEINEQMEETGKYDDELIERIYDEVDSNFIPLAFMQIAQEIKGDRMTLEQKKHVDAFEYWVKTNTENGVCILPESICKDIIAILKDKDGDAE